MSVAEANGVASPTAKRKKPKHSKRGLSTPKLDRARAIVRERLTANKPISPHKLEEQHGDISHVTFDMAITAELARSEILKELAVDPVTLSATARAKLEATRLSMERKLNAQHAERMRGLDEEVRKRVTAEGKEYIERMEGLEAKAWQNEKHWREMVNNHKPPFTSEQFKSILMCLHPDGQRTQEKLSSAFLLFNEKKLQLSGER